MKIFSTVICFILLTMHSHAWGKDQTLLIGDNYLSKAKIKIIKESAKEKGLDLEVFSVRGFNKENSIDSLCNYKLVMFKAVGDEIATTLFPKFSKKISSCANTSALRSGFSVLPELDKGLDNKTIAAIKQYLDNGLRENYENMSAYINTHVLSKSQNYGSAIILPLVGFYHPEYKGMLTADKPSFMTWLNNRKQNASKVAVLFHRSAVETEQSQLVDATIKAIEKNGGQGYAVFFDGKDKDTYVDVLKGSVNAVINYRMLHEANKNKAEFATLNVPVIQGLIYRDGDRAHFDDAMAGLSAMMSPYFLMMPESAGIIDPTMVATTNQTDKSQVPMLDHVNAVANRAVKQASLSSTKNADKKVTLFMWNYPPGDKNMGAAFLNVPESIHAIAQAMAEDNYDVEPKSPETLIEEVGKILRPFYTQQGLSDLMSQGLSDYLPLKDYMNWLEAQPYDLAKNVAQHWGDAKDHAYVRNVNGEPAFIIPQIKMGNLIAMPQPSKSDPVIDNTDSSMDAAKKDHKSIYHDTQSPMNHYYLAVYLYAKQKFNTDAFINLGTHGSQEWLQGKERGLSIHDAPQLTVGDVPVIYPYIMDNVGEAMQGKRRGRATMISHMTPGFAQAGHYGPVAELEESIEEFMTLSTGQTKEVVKARIIELANDVNVYEDIGFSKEDVSTRFDAFLIELHDYLHELAEESQPLGLHTFAQTLEDTHLVTTVVQMLGGEFIELATDYEKNNTFELKQKPDVFSQALADNNTVQLDETHGFKMIWAHLIEKQTLNVPDELVEHMNKASEFEQKIRGQIEMPSLLRALKGEFIDVGYGGDPVRSHDALPTGKNLLGFNPAKVPSKAAWQVGQKLVEDLIAKHYQEKGQYPDKLAFSLWSLETMRHHGVLESQVLAAMGMKPKWDDNGFLRGTELIPYSELKRPRVDVVLSATGLYRDAFPNVMLMLAKAIKEVAELKEEHNFIYQNTLALKDTLIKEGQTPEEAEYLSSVRIFSNESGAYGSGLADASLASDTWEKDSKLAYMYLKRMGYAFGSDAKRWSDKVPDLYGKALSGTDAVLFSRSTNLYGMITSDDPFQYFGGISLAVRNIDGKSPEMYIANLREKDHAKTDNINRFMARELRNRTFHPRWIEEVQKEGYSGALQMLDRINNFWGWTVMHPEGVTDAQWQEFADIYVKDKYNMDMREFFEKANPTNLAQMIERMLEAERKDYWETDDATIKELVETYLEVKQQHAVFTENEAFKEYVEAKAQGFGLQALHQASEMAMAESLAAQAPSQNAEIVEGQKLEQIEAADSQPTETDWSRYLFLLLLLGAFIVGLAQSYFSNTRLLGLKSDIAVS